MRANYTDAGGLNVMNGREKSKGLVGADRGVGINSVVHMHGE
jgi:hypothetical protein